MALPTHILLIYGYLLLFAWVLVEQFGIPLPATPVLLAAGALSAEHQFSFPSRSLVGVAASLIADSTWFLVGRSTATTSCASSASCRSSPPSASATPRTPSAAAAASPS